MVALQRGQLARPEHGAIACFERGWDADEEHLNPMAYVALHRIHAFLGPRRQRGPYDGLNRLKTLAAKHAVAAAWIEAIEQGLVGFRECNPSPEMRC